MNKLGFSADVSNRKWVADISYIHAKQGHSIFIIRDLYDRSIVAYKTGTKKTANPILDTIRLVVRKEKNSQKEGHCKAATPQ